MGSVSEASKMAGCVFSACHFLLKQTLPWFDTSAFQNIINRSTLSVKTVIDLQGNQNILRRIKQNYELS